MGPLQASDFYYVDFFMILSLDKTYIVRLGFVTRFGRPAGRIVRRDSTVSIMSPIVTQLQVPGNRKPETGNRKPKIGISIE